MTPGSSSGRWPATATATAGSAGGTTTSWLRVKTSPGGAAAAPSFVCWCLSTPSAAVFHLILLIVMMSSCCCCAFVPLLTAEARANAYANANARAGARQVLTLPYQQPYQFLQHQQQHQQYSDGSSGGPSAGTAGQLLTMGPYVIGPSSPLQQLVLYSALNTDRAVASADASSSSSSSSSSSPDDVLLLVPAAAASSGHINTAAASVLTRTSPFLLAGNNDVPTNDGGIGTVERDGLINVALAAAGLTPASAQQPLIHPSRGLLQLSSPNNALSTGKISSARMIRNGAADVTQGYAIFYQRGPLFPVVVLAALQSTDAAGTNANAAMLNRNDLVLEVRSGKPEFDATPAIQCASTGGVFNPTGVPGGGVITSSFATNAGSIGAFFTDTIPLAKLSLYTLNDGAKSINGRTLVWRSPVSGDLACGTIVEA